MNRLLVTLLLGLLVAAAAAGAWLLLRRDDPGLGPIETPRPAAKPTPARESTSGASPSRPDASPEPITPRPFAGVVPEPDLPPQTVPSPPPGSEATFIVGRLLEATGVPMAGKNAARALEVVATNGAIDRHAPELNLESDGRFRMQLVLPFAASSGSRREVCFAAGGAKGARIDLTRDLSSGDHDVGEVTLTKAPLIAAGTVVDQGGQPLQGAIVTPILDRDGPAAGRLLERSYLTRLWAVSDAEGAFEMYGFLGADEFVVEATSSGWNSSARASVTLGDRDVRLVLRRGGTLEGRVLLDPGVPPSLVVVDARSGPRNQHRPQTLLHDGTFQHQTNAGEPTTLRVTIEAVGVDKPLADIAGIVVRPGETTHDPRLDPLDLRGRLRALSIDVVDRDGAPVKNAIVVVEPPGAGAERGVRTTDGRAQVLTMGAAVDLRVEAEGYRAARLSRVLTDARVVLRPGLSVRIRFSDSPPELPAGWKASVRLTAADDVPRAATEGESAGVGYLFTNRGVGTTGSARATPRQDISAGLDARWVSADLAVPEPGAYGVVLKIERTGEFRRGWGVPYSTPPRITVLDQDGLQVIAVPAPPADAITRAMAMLGE